MTSLESHGHPSGHADAETPLAPEIVAEPLSAAAPVLVQRERVRGADGSSVIRFAVRFPPDVPLPPELRDLPRYVAISEGPLIDLGMGITVTLVGTFFMMIAVGLGSFGWAGVVFALLAMALVIGPRTPRAARLIPSRKGRIVLLDELPENVAMSPLQRLWAERSGVTFDQVVFPLTAFAGLSDHSGVLRAVGIGGALLSSLLEWLAGPAPDEEEHSPGMHAQRDLRRRLRLASRVVAIGPVVAYGVLLHDFEKGMPRWMAVLFGTVVAILTVRKFLESDAEVGAEPPGATERSSATTVQHGFERFHELADPARPLSPEDFGAPAPGSPSHEPVPQLRSPSGG